jgi:hypothetical protein
VLKTKGTNVLRRAVAGPRRPARQRGRGYVSAAGEDSFTVADAQTGVAAVVPYPQVKKVSGHNLSTGAKVAIGGGIVAAVVVILWAVADKDFTN